MVGDFLDVPLTLKIMIKIIMEFCTTKGDK